MFLCAQDYQESGQQDTGKRTSKTQYRSRLNTCSIIMSHTKLSCTEVIEQIVLPWSREVTFTRKWSTPGWSAKSNTCTLRGKRWTITYMNIIRSKATKENRNKFESSWVTNIPQEKVEQLILTMNSNCQVWGGNNLTIIYQICMCMLTSAYNCQRSQLRW